MKPYYKISELSRLYGLCSDTLRYYEEQGLLHPQRGTNNYRLYGLGDIYALNMIRDLRKLDMPLELIKRYATERTVQSTVDLLEHQQGLIEDRIADLKKAKKDIDHRLEKLRQSQVVSVGEVECKHLPARGCYSLDLLSITESEVDFQLHRLESSYGDTLKMVGNLVMGARVEQKSLEQGIYDRFDHVFFLASARQGANHLLAQGDYACIVYRGSYSGLKDAYHALLKFCEENQLIPDAAPIELYHVEGHDTDSEKEFLTEMQMKVKNNPQIG